MRCKGITKIGNQCSRKTNNEYCYWHQQKKQKKKEMYCSTIECVDRLDFEDENISISSLLAYGDYIFIGKSKGGLSRWNIKTNEVISFSNESERISCLIEYNDSLFSACDDCSIVCWGIETGVILAKFSWQFVKTQYPLDYNIPESIIIYHNNLYCGIRTGIIKCWSLDDTQLLFSKSRHTDNLEITNLGNKLSVFNDYIYGMGHHSDGNNLVDDVIIMDENCIALRRINTYAKGGIWGFYQCRDQLFIHAWDGILRSLDMNNKLSIRQKFKPCTGSICFYKNILFAVSHYGLEEWDEDNRINLDKSDSNLLRLCKSTDGKYLFSTGHGGYIKKWQRIIPSVANFNKLNKDLRKIIFTFASANKKLKLVDRNIFNEIIRYL